MHVLVDDQDVEEVLDLPRHGTAPMHHVLAEGDDPVFGLQRREDRGDSVPHVFRDEVGAFPRVAG
jgi:hypothetical protein